MDNFKEIRWKQRFTNYEKAYKSLEKYILIKNPSEIERAGGIQFFEICFELAWKMLKDFLEAEGFIINSPRETLKQAFQNEIISNGHIWINALDDRNLTTHIYDEKKAVEVEERIRLKYFPLLKDLYIKMKDKV